MSNNLKSAAIALAQKEKTTPAGVARALNALNAKKEEEEEKKQEAIRQQQYTQTRNNVNTMEDKIRDQIKVERHVQGMTQRDLAFKSGMSQGTITRAERGLDVSLRTLMRISIGLNKELTLK